MKRNSCFSGINDNDILFLIGDDKMTVLKALGALRLNIGKREELIDKNDFVLEQKLEEWIENGKNYPIIMKKFNRYLEKKEKIK